MMFFYTIVCSHTNCVWSYGPTSKRTAKQMMSLHKEIHRLEDMLREAS